MKIKKNSIIPIFLIVFLVVCNLVYAGTTETSGITAATIITRAERYLDAGSDPFFTDDDFVQWIDEAVRETVNRTGCLDTAPITIALVADTSRYDPGQSFLQVFSVEHDNGDTTDDRQVITLDRVHKNDIGHNNESGRPKIYTVWNDQIEIWPIPRSDEAGTSLYVYTVGLPTGVSATSSSIETPAYLDVALLYYTVAMAHMKEGNLSKAQGFLVLYERRINEYNALVVRRRPIE